MATHTRVTILIFSTANYTTKMTKQKIKQSVREELVSYIEENIKDYIDTEVSELHHNLFNTGYYIVGSYDAKQWLKSHDLDGLEVLNEVVEFEMDNFGEVSETRIKELTSYEKLVSSYVYWVGEEMLSEVDCLSDNWDNFLTEEIADKVIAEL